MDSPVEIRRGPSPSCSGSRFVGVEFIPGRMESYAHKRPDDTLRRAMEDRHRAVARWEEPLTDEETGGPLAPSVLAGDAHVKRYLQHADTIGKRGTVLRYALDLIVRNVTEGVQYGEEAYYFGQAGASSGFRQSIARFRNRAPLPRRGGRPRRGNAYGSVSWWTNPFRRRGCGTRNADNEYLAQSTAEFGGIRQDIFLSLSVPCKGSLPLRDVENELY